MSQLLRTSDVARRLGVSSVWVRVLESQGRIPALKTVTGCRVFRSEDVDRVADEREMKKQMKSQQRGPEEPEAA
jgi:DNA-binding transcriptional MerR regulator